MRKYVIMGVQGSGKGTQSEMLAADLDLVHISVGDIFRWHVANHTKMGTLVQRGMTAGELVGDDLVESVIQQRLTEHDWNFGFILDGFPRNVPQAEFLLESYDIDAVIELDLPDSDVRQRVQARDSSGGELTARDDDTEQALEVRLREFHEKTRPVLDLFRQKESVITVDARPSREDVQQEIRLRLGLPPYKEDAAKGDTAQ
jgi:adenylate kinase